MTSTNSTPDAPSAGAIDSDTSAPSGTARAADTPSKGRPTGILDQESILAILSTRWSCDLGEVRSRLATWLAANPDPNSIERERNSRPATEQDARLTHIDHCKRFDRQVTFQAHATPTDPGDVDRWWEPDDRAASGVLPLRHAEVRAGRSMAEGGADRSGREGGLPSAVPVGAVQF